MTGSSLRIIPWLRGSIIAVIAVLWMVSGAAAEPVDLGVVPDSGIHMQGHDGDVGDELSEPTPFQNWQLLLPIIINVLVSAVTKASWSDAARSWTMVGCSIILTAFGMFLQGTLDTSPVDVIAEILKVIVASVAFYYGVFKPTGGSGAVRRATGG